MNLIMRIINNTTGLDRSTELKEIEFQIGDNFRVAITAGGVDPAPQSWPRASVSVIGPKPRFTKLDADGKELPSTATNYAFFIDNLLNLMHPVDEICEPKNWKNAGIAASKYRGLGHDDWQVLSPLAGVSLVDYSRFNPAGNPIIPNMKPERHWTNMPDPSDPADCAFCVDFSYGYVYIDFQNDHARVRAVRSVVPAGQ